MAPSQGAQILVVAADPRVRAAVAGFLEPAGHCVAAVRAETLADPQALLAQAEGMDLALVDWSLTAPLSGHLGALLHRALPALHLIALMPRDTGRPEPDGWDGVATLPLAGDILARIIDGWREGRDERD